MAMWTATRIQITTYLLCVCLLSITFLVFLNASVSFVVTDLLGVKKGVGDIVGTLGFVDELVAIVACPVWGALSDRIGVRTVSCAGFAIVAVALCLFVQCRDVYPQLILARILFSFGACATATMLTAILPSMTLPENPVLPVDAEIVGAPPTSSDVTEGSPTQARADASQIFLDADEDNSAGSSSKLAGIVGLFTGFGALLALGLFLPLPAHFQKLAYSPGEAVQYSYYITAAVSLIASGLCFVGLRNLRGEANKTWRTFKSEHSGSRRSMFRSYFGLLMEAVKLGFQNALIGIAYIGGFVARASSVGISLFIPLYVNAYYVSSGICNSDPTSDPSEIKSGCRQAYIMAAKLTGTSQLVALVLAPVFGYAGSRYQRYNMPLIVAALAGIFGYGGFALLKFSGEDRNVLVYFSVALIGVSQIGCIVCSLGSLSRGILGLEQPKRKCQNGESSTAAAADEPGTENANDFSTEGDCLLSKPLQERNNLNYLKGSIAGIYSFGGGVGILLLTKLGGWLFDTSSPAAPFYMLASFNIALLLATFLITVLR